MATVADLYRQILGREPDAAGLAAWTQAFGPTIDPAEYTQFQQAAASEIASRAANPTAPTTGVAGSGATAPAAITYAAPSPVGDFNAFSNIVQNLTPMALPVAGQAATATTTTSTLPTYTATPVSPLLPGRVGYTDSSGNTSYLPNGMDQYFNMTDAQLAALPPATIAEIRKNLIINNAAATDSNYDPNKGVNYIPQGVSGTLMQRLDAANPTAAAQGVQQAHVASQSMGGTMLQQLSPLLTMAGIAGGTLGIGGLTGATVAPAAAGTTAFDLPGATGWTSGIGNSGAAVGALNPALGPSTVTSTPLPPSTPPNVPLPPGGMIGTGEISAADATMAGVGAGTGGAGAGGVLTTTGGIGAGGVLNAAKTAADVAGATTGTGPASWTDWLTTALGVGGSIYTAIHGTGVSNTAAQNAVDPFAPYRAQYGAQLNNLMSNPASVTTLPGYQFIRDQGQQGVQRVLAAQGRTVSGREQLALQEQDQSLAMNMYNDQYNKLAQLSGASANPAAGGNAFINNATGNTNAVNAGIGGIMGGLANMNTPNTAGSRVVNDISNWWR